MMISDYTVLAVTCPGLAECCELPERARNPRPSRPDRGEYGGEDDTKNVGSLHDCQGTRHDQVAGTECPI